MPLSLNFENFPDTYKFDTLFSNSLANVSEGFGATRNPRQTGSYRRETERRGRCKPGGSVARSGGGWCAFNFDHKRAASGRACATTTRVRRPPATQHSSRLHARHRSWPVAFVCALVCAYLGRRRCSGRGCIVERAKGAEGGKETWPRRRRRRRWRTMQRGRQKTMSCGGGQTGGKNTRRAPNPGLSSSAATDSYTCVRVQCTRTCV